MRLGQRVVAAVVTAFVGVAAVAVPAGAEPIRWEAGTGGWDPAVGLAGNLDLDRFAAVDRSTGVVSVSGPDGSWTALPALRGPTDATVRPVRLALSTHRIYAMSPDGVYRLESGPPDWKRVAAAIPELLASRDGSLTTVPN